MQQLPEEILAFCEHTFGGIIAYQPVSGGCINNGGKLSTSSFNYFLKWNDAQKFPQMFTKEAIGLKELAKNTDLTVPDVIESYEGEKFSCLILQWIDSSAQHFDFWEKFGYGVAHLHQTTSNKFGLGHDNFMGSLPQPNAQTTSLVEFFINQRLNPQLKLAKESGRIDAHTLQQFDTLKSKLDQLLISEEPHLIHGDLWSGNFMRDSSGMPALIDPAISYGHREMDIAMTTLFGGFDHSFYKHYQIAYPLSPGYEDRLEIYNLYPLLVHVNLFGGGYLNQVKNILTKFTS